MGKNFGGGEGAIFLGGNFPGTVFKVAICSGAIFHGGIFRRAVFNERIFSGRIFWRGQFPVPQIPYDTFSDQIGICHISLEIYLFLFASKVNIRVPSGYFPFLVQFSIKKKLINKNRFKK